ncbi:hypothetical protein P3W70_07125 [Achromobacter denitrificans]|uniref:hypothetical protein n=1 Tax=Achromobacter denitrificans TaxID=32002 RepID=UPI0023E76045|nr:hypothetical protein [Achromobacter denitrificans]MDF3858111.1 hypothetical protein [Achromobacter denitrificans]
MDRKAFQIVMRKIETRISEQTVTVHAETEDDARVLAKYEECPSYLWDRVREEEIVKVAVVKRADDPATHYGNLAQIAQQQVAGGDARN